MTGENTCLIGRGISPQPAEPAPLSGGKAEFFPPRATGSWAKKHFKPAIDDQKIV
jgi:hypothetical protein